MSLTIANQAFLSLSFWFNAHGLINGFFFPLCYYHEYHKQIMELNRRQKLQIEMLSQNFGFLLT